MSFEGNVTEHERRRRAAAAMGGEAKLAARRAKGALNVRERIACLLDEGSFEEVGLFGTPSLEEPIPADGKVTGFGRVDGRDVAVVAYDFTVKGSSSGPIGERKVAHIKRTATENGLPIVFLGESTGARMPDVMGGEGMAGLGGPTRFRRTRETPWVAAVLGNAFGSAAWHAVVSDFAVMRKGSVMAVSSPLLIAHATGEKADAEDVGGWQLHSEVTGYADRVAESDEEAIQTLRRVLAYLPSHRNDAPPRAAVPQGSEGREASLLALLPEASRTVYDMRKMLDVIADRDSVFELKPRFARSLITALCRIRGRVVGVIANNPMVKGGAVDADACDKATSFLVFCDSYNIPIVTLVDQPGFLVGLDAERKRITGKVINWMNALSLCTVPRIMIIVRKSYGQAYVNMGGGGMMDEAAAWWSADISFMSPEAASAIVAGSNLEMMARDNSAYALAAALGVNVVIDPRETRDYLDRMLAVHSRRLESGIGKHLLCAWPTSY